MSDIKWKKTEGFEDIKYEVAEGIAKITVDRPKVRNAFRPRTVTEMSRVSTFSVSNAKFARYPSPSSRWSRATQSAAVTCCMICDLTIAAENARFGRTGLKVGSFDGGYGASYMARIVGQKKAREKTAKRGRTRSSKNESRTSNASSDCPS